MEKASLYIGASFATLMLNTVFAVLFVLHMREDGALAVLMAQALSNTIMMLVYTAILLRLSIPNVRFRHWGPLLSFSLPLIPSKIIAAAAAVVDRFLLEKFISLNDLGLYQVTIRFARLLDMVMNGLRTAWIPLEMRLIVERPEDGREMVGRIAPIFIFIVLLVTVGLANVLGYLVKFVDIEEYLPVIVLLPFAVLPRAIEGVATVLIQGYAIARKTHFAWLESTAVLIGAIVGNILLVPPLGVYGAFAASTLSVTLGGIIGYYFSARFFYIPFAWSAIFRLSAGAVFVIIIGQVIRLESSFVGLAFTSGLVIAYAAWALYLPLDGHKWVASHQSEVRRMLRFWKQEG